MNESIRWSYQKLVQYRKGPRHRYQFDMIIALPLKLRDLLSLEEKGFTRIKPVTTICIPSAHQTGVTGCS